MQKALSKSDTVENLIENKLISTFMRSSFPSQTKKCIFRNYKKFDEGKFLSDFKNANFSFTSADPNEFIFPSSRETCSYKKKKTLRGNHAPFVSMELRKAIYTEIGI